MASFSTPAKLSVAALLVSTPTTTLLFRVSRMNKSKDELYSPPELNLVAEVLKLLGSAFMLLFTAQGAIVASPEKRKEGLRSPKNWLLCFIPSLLYFVQNIMCVVAMGFFPSSLFIAVANTKILCTALFSKVIVGATFSFDSILYLVLLTAGVGVASTASSGESRDTAATVPLDASVAGVDAAAEEAAMANVQAMAAFHLGLLLALLTALCSGLAGAYTQKFLQQSFNNVWEANLVMGFTSALFSAVSVFVMAEPGRSPVDLGPFHNWSGFVWAAALLQAGHGILSAFAIKLTSSVIKSVIGAAAIIATSAIDTTVFHDPLSITTVLGEIIIACTAIGYINAQQKVAAAIPRQKSEPQLASSASARGVSSSSLSSLSASVSAANADPEADEGGSLLAGKKGGAAPFDGVGTPRSQNGGGGIGSGSGGQLLCRATNTLGAGLVVFAAVVLAATGTAYIGGHSLAKPTTGLGSAGGGRPDAGAGRRLAAVLAGIEHS